VRPQVWQRSWAQRFVQVQMYYFQESKNSQQVQRASLVGGTVEPMTVPELGEKCPCGSKECPGTEPCPAGTHSRIVWRGSAQKSRFPLAQSRRQWEGLSSNSKENLAKRRYKALVAECCRFDPLTLPWGRAPRVDFDPAKDAEAREHDLMVAMRLQEAYQAKYRDAAAKESPGGGRGAGEGGEGAGDDMFEGGGGDAANPEVGAGNEAAAAAAEAGEAAAAAPPAAAEPAPGGQAADAAPAPAEKPLALPALPPSAASPSILAPHSPRPPAVHDQGARH
jgi:hypothetical protein